MSRLTFRTRRSLPRWTADWLRDSRLLLTFQFLAAVGTLALAIIVARALGPSIWGLFSGLLGLPLAVAILVEGRLGTRLLRENSALRADTASHGDHRDTAALPIAGALAAMGTIGAALITASIVIGMEAKTPTSEPKPSPAPTGFPASFFTGPLGTANVLPGKTTGALFGTWLPGVPGGTWDQQRQLFLDRQAAVGRKYDIAHIHYPAPLEKCYWVAPMSDARAQWSSDNGYTQVLSWTHGWTIDEVNAGLADACLEEVGARFAAWGKPVLLRTYWEFNGNWFNWSGSGEAFISAWKRTVSKIRAGGGTNVGFIWSPDSSHRERAFASYPGDEWVDWIGVSAYNFNNDGWCGPNNPGPWCELAQVLTHDPVNAPSVYDVYSERKPFMVAETGSVEDPASPGRKGQWLRNASEKIPTDVSNVRAFTYFDMDVSAYYDSDNLNFLLDTSQSSLEGWRDLALSPFFRTRSSLEGWRDLALSPFFRTR